MTPPKYNGHRLTFPGGWSIPDSDRQAASQSSVDDAAEQGLNKTSSPDIIIVRNRTADAPNIALNSQNQSGRGELHYVAVIGSILQLGVLVYFGLATYYPKLKFRKDGHPVAGYAFPCTAAGTLVLMAGMLICAHGVESSTKERYRPGQGRKTRLVWVQKAKTVSDQLLGSFAVFATDEQTVITTSHRGGKENKAAILEPKTVIGTIVSLCGFVVQFIGLRGMDWSASVAQLGAVLVMTSLRAWVRRGLAKQPECQELSAGFELDWLATTLGEPAQAAWLNPSKVEKEGEASPCTDWAIVTGRDRATYGPLRQTGTRKNGTHDEHEQTSERDDLHKSSRVLRVMMIRRDLGELADWRGPACAEAIALVRSIEVVMEAFLDNLEGEFVWSLRRVWEVSETADTINWSVTEGNAANVLLATEFHSPLKLLYAQDMFSSFMRAVAMTLEDPINGSADIRSDDSSGTYAWQSFTLHNDRLAKLAQDIQSTGLEILKTST